MRKTILLSIITAGLIIADTAFAAIPEKQGARPTVHTICAKFKKEHPGQPCNYVYINCTGLNTIYLGTTDWMHSIAIHNNQILADPGISRSGMMSVTLSNTEGAAPIGSFMLTPNPTRDVNKITYDKSGATGDQIKVHYTKQASCH